MGAGLRAALVHLYTAQGAVLAFFALAAVARGAYSQAFLLLLIAYLVDATDGFLARRWRVRETLPGIDGEMLDLVIDFLTYAVVPLFLLWRAEVLPAPAEAWAVLVLLAACYDFAKVHALKEAGFYTGLPAMWNIYAFYAYHLRPHPLVQAAAIVVLLALTFLPLRFVYPSHTPRAALRWYVAGLGLLVLTVLGVVLRLVPDQSPWVVASLVLPAAYLLHSLRAGRRPLAAA